MPTPNRLTSGLSFSPSGWAFGDVPFPTPPYWYQYFNDFSTYAAGDWTVTSGGTGTTGLTGGAGGFLIQTTNNVDNDLQANQLASKSFAFTSGQDVAFFINAQWSAVAGSTGPDVLFGLMDTLADITPTDGVYFNKPQNSTTLSLKVQKAGTATTVTVGTVAAATAYTFGFYYRGSAAVPTLTVFSTIPYADGTVTQPSPYWPGGSLTVLQGSANADADFALTNLPLTTTNLTLAFGLQSGTTAAQTATYDYVYAGQSVSRY